MRYLIDANVFLRQAQPRDPHFAVADNALRVLAGRGEVLCVVPQTLYEFWVVSTRPTTARGDLGWTPAQTETELARLESIFELLPDEPLYFQWRRLVTTYGVSGVNAHDARLVAAMKVHRLTHLLTCNAKNFRRYEAAENIAVVEPDSVP